MAPNITAEQRHRATQTAMNFLKPILATPLIVALASSTPLTRVRPLKLVWNSVSQAYLFVSVIKRGKM